MKKHLLVAALFLAAMALSAQEPFAVSSGDFALYNESGERLALDENAARTATNGWIVQTQDRPVTIQTPVGTIELAANTTLVTGDLSETRPSLYLVDGEASFSTARDFTGRLTVSTPVSRYRATGYSGMLVTTNAGEEAISMFVGSAQSVNGLTHKATQVKAMERLDQKTGQITLLGAEDKDSWERSLAHIPDAPTFGNVVVTPYPGSIPSQPQTLTVTRLPAAPGGLSVRVISIAPAPSQVSVSTAAIGDDAFIPAPTPSQLEASLPDGGIHVPATGKEHQPKKASARMGVTLSYEYDRAGEYFYINGGNRISKNLHQFSAKPYVESKYFGLKLDLAVQTLDYEDWDNDWSSNLTHFDSDGWKETTSSIMSYIDSFHLGSKAGHLWMAVDKEPLNEEGRIMTGYHAVQPDWKNLSLGMRFGSVRINGSFDDVELHHMRETDRSLKGWQYGNLSLSLVDDDLSFFSFGAVYALHGDSTVTFQERDEAGAHTYRSVSYPYAEINIPFLGNRRQYHLNLLGSAATYLPVSPDMDFDYIYDSDESSFDNFLLTAGLSFGTKAWDVQLTAGHHKGFINPYVRSPFVRTMGMNYLQYKADMDARLQATYKGRCLSFGASYTLPFDFDQDDKIARFSDGVHADMLSIGLSAQLKGFTLGAGYEVYGLNDMHGLDDADDLSTMLKASLAYDWSFLHLEGGVKRNIDSSTSPLVGYALCELDFHKGF